MYQNMRINVPKESMGFPDLPFEKENEGHRDVREYLTDYAEMHKILPHIKVNSKVTSITRTEEGKWNVETNGNDISVFDFIIIANGHHSVPCIPKQFEESSFQGEIMHSHFYRRPEDFAGKNVTGKILFSGRFL